MSFPSSTGYNSSDPPQDGSQPFRNEPDALGMEDDEGDAEEGELGR